MKTLSLDIKSLKLELKRLKNIITPREIRCFNQLNNLVEAYNNKNDYETEVINYFIIKFSKILNHASYKIAHHLYCGEGEGDWFEYYGKY